MPDSSPEQSTPAAPPAQAGDAKHFLDSRTIQGVLILLLPTALRRLGIVLDDAGVQAIAGDLVELLGAALAIYGRAKATQPITFKTSAVSPSAMILLALGAAFALAVLPGCAQLPAGSYLEAGGGFSKDSGVTGKALVHIPLDRGFAK